MKEQTRQRKRPYGGLLAAPVAILGRTSLLAASVVRHSTVQPAGQELGPTYDFSSEDRLDSNTRKTFSQDWETGIN